MYVITVIPISRGIGKETLSYFTATSVELGSMVSVPLRKKIVDALVIRSKDAREMKSELKSADFALRKVDRLVSRPFLPEAFMETVEEAARWHAATVGATLKVMLPKNSSPTKITKAPSREDKSEVKNISAQLERRIDIYKEEMSKDKGVIFVPTKERQILFKKVLGVPVYLPSQLVEIPADTALIIIEEPSSSSYKSISRPFIDFRFAIERYAKKIGASVIVGSESLNPSVKKYIDENKKEDGRPFSAIGKALEQDLKSMKEIPRHLFILATRRGHSGTVLCQDCGSPAHCERCDAPLTLHLKSAKEDFNNLVCHHCGLKTTALTGCKQCGSWRLKSFGLGVEKIEEDVKAFVKKHSIEAYVQRLDSTLKLTPKRMRGFVDTHYEKENAILIATEIALPYLADATLTGKRNDGSYIASLDTLLSLPDFSINEKIWKLCSLLDDVSEKKVVIQTRDGKNGLLEMWKKNDEKKFWKEELEARSAFNYPPCGVFIKITVKGKKEKIGAEMRAIESRLTKWNPMVFPAFIKAVNYQHILHALIAMPKEEWVDEELLSILLSLPPSVRIEVNPRSLL